MECNKDDAIKATELAEKKYATKDLVGAKKFCGKALKLFPGLERAKQLLAVVEVHAAAQVKLSEGLEDWYGILQLDPVADDSTIKKQYRKLALMLHPDKNSLAGAEPAFKIINEAWGTLSDKSKKTIYDLRRSACVRKASPPPPPPPPAPAEEANGCSSEFVAATAAPPSSTSVTESNNPEGASASASAAAGPDSGQPTFWTQCPSCKIQYQYYRKFEDFQLLCHRCKAGFIAKDIGIPPGEYQPVASSKQKNKAAVAANGGDAVNGVHEGAGAAASTAFQQMQQKAREREERKKEEERRKSEREKEREEKRKLREALKKAKEEDRRREALERQMAKQREREEKEARKKNMEALKKKFKKNKMEEDDDDDDDDEEDDGSDEEKLGEEAGSPRYPPEVSRYGLRRSSRTRKNVTYRDDFEDEDGEGHAAKRARVDEPEIDVISPEDLELRQEFSERGKKLVLDALKSIIKKAFQEVKAEETPEEVKAEEAPEEVKAEEAPEEVKAEAPEEGKTKAPEGREAAEAADTSVPAASSSFSAEKENLPPPEAVIDKKSVEVGAEEVIVITEEKVEEAQCKEEEEETLSEAASEAEEEQSHYLVPDPDFHNFDKDRKEESVVEGQVWALYDDAEGMPRFYCEIKVVVSVQPFKVRIRWLERYEASEEGEAWEKAGLAATCGEFKCKRKTETEEHFNKFSHLMEVERQGNVFRIFPKSGEVWAVYRNWEVKLRDPEMELKYDMVEVVGSYFEETGMSVLQLVKVEGYKTIFARGAQSVVSFAGKDLLRFSHKVPAHWMTGLEKENAPRDCWELDTAATPSHLIFKDR